jgi:hypothetical protein
LLFNVYATLLQKHTKKAFKCTFGFDHFVTVPRMFHAHNLLITKKKIGKNIFYLCVLLVLTVTNEYNSSESNILSVANNQRILHHFLFGKDTEFDSIDITQRPKTYFPHRTKTSFAYNFGKDLHLELDNIQIEIDLTIEFQGTIGVFEGKNGKHDSFAVYQIYHPFLYYYKASQLSELKGKIKEIYGVYVVKTIENGITNLKIWAYTFKNPLDIVSIKFVKSVCYS